MAEAIDTKKRRLARALDSFTAASQSSLSISGSTTSAKRPATATAAFDEARERARKRLRQSTSSSSLPRNIVPAVPPKTDGAKSKDPPNYSPWSHEAFLARLKTFSSVSLWHPKPEPIGEVEWAKRGWLCVDVNTVRCKGGCEKRVVVSLDKSKRTSAANGNDMHAEDDDDEDEEAGFERAMVERYQDVIVNGHTEKCPWRTAGCKDDIYHLQVVRPSVWQKDVRDRYISLMDIGSAIQYVVYRPLDRSSSNLPSNEKLLKDLPGYLLEESRTVTEKTRSRALDFALHGWAGSTESKNELLKCNDCFQRIGLWMYQPGYRPAGASRDVEDGEDEAFIDLVEMHREHCPWRNPTTQKGTGTLAGLNASQILQRVVATYAREHKRKSDGQNGQLDSAAQAENTEEDPPVYDKEEIARQDKERESRLRKLKSLFTIKRRSKSVPKAAV